jgi:MFS family permease
MTDSTGYNSSFMFGYDAGVMTDVIGSNNFLNYFNTDKTSPTIGAINSTFNGGAVFGSLMGGLTMDRYGRKMTIQIGAIVCSNPLTVRGDYGGSLFSHMNLSGAFH